MPAGSSSVISSRSVSWLTPSSAATRTDEIVSGLLARTARVAWARVNAVYVVGPRLSASPNVAMPTIGDVDGLGVSTVVRSPTAQVALLGRAAVDHDLAGGRGGPALGEVGRG